MTVDPHDWPTRLKRDFERVIDEIGHVPVFAEYKEHGEHPPAKLSAVFLEKPEQDYYQAVREMGYDIETPSHPIQVPDDELIADYERVKEIVGRVPFLEDYVEHGEYDHKTFARRFDPDPNGTSYYEAVRELGDTIQQ